MVCAKCQQVPRHLYIGWAVKGKAGAWPVCGWGATEAAHLCGPQRDRSSVTLVSITPAQVGLGPILPAWLALLTRGCPCRRLYRMRALQAGL